LSSISAGNLPPTPLDELTTLPKTPNWIWEGKLEKPAEKGEKMREGKGNDGKRGGCGGNERMKGKGERTAERPEEDGKVHNDEF